MCSLLHSGRQEEGLSHTSVEVSLEPQETTGVTAETSSPLDTTAEVTAETSHPADTAAEVAVETTSVSELAVFQRRWRRQASSTAHPQIPPHHTWGSGPHASWDRRWGGAMDGENLRPEQAPDGGTGPDSPREPQQGGWAPERQREPPLGTETSGQRWREGPGWVGRLGSPGRPPVLEKTTKTLLWGLQGPQEIKSVCVLQGQWRPSSRKKCSHHVKHI